MDPLTLIAMIFLGVMVVALSVVAGLVFGKEQRSTLAGPYVALMAVTFLIGFYSAAVEIGTGLPDDPQAFSNGIVYKVIGYIRLEPEDQQDGLKFIVLIRHGDDGKIRAHRMESVPPPVFRYSYSVKDNVSPYIPYPDN